MEDKAIKLLRRLRGYVDSATDSGFKNATNAVHISPAQRLRQAADEMESRDAFLREVDEFLSNN